MAEAMDSGCLAPGFNTATEEEGRAIFQTGDAVFMRNWPYAYQLIQDEGDPQVANNFDIAPLPTFSGEGTISALGGFNNAVSAFSSNIDAAKEFVVWASTDPEVQKMLATQASVPPVLTSVYDELQNEPDMALLSEVLPDAKPRPPAPTWTTISLDMQDALFPAYNGDADPADASETVADAFNESVEE
jgi:multiple sugar transport system substrate-binding protein